MASTHIARISAGGVNDRRIAHSLYGYCTTAAATKMKEVSLYAGPGVNVDGPWASQDLFHGLSIKIRFQYANSASGPTLNVNNTGALPIFRYGTSNSTNDAIGSWQSGLIVTFTYDTLLYPGGCWVINHGYRTGNDNTIGYQIRTNSMSLPMSSDLYRYRILFTSADGTHFVPANNSNSTSTTTEKEVNQEKIDPFGLIVAYSTTTTVTAGNRPGPTYLWHQYTVSFGYSFNTTGEDLTLTPWTPVYIKCTPQSDGSAIIDPETPYVQELPSEKDGKIYIFFGVAYNTGAVLMFINHPVYYYDGNKIKLWTGETIDCNDILNSAYIENEMSGGLASFSDGANNIPVKSLIVNIKSIQDGINNPAPDNIRPINAWTRVKIVLNEKNLINKNIEYINEQVIDTHGKNSSNSSYRYTKPFIGVKPSTTYSVRYEKTTSISTAFTVVFYNSNKQFISRGTAISSTSSTGILYGNFTTPANCKYIKFNVASFNTDNIQIEEGNTSTDYSEPTVYNINFPLEAGTVYGGRLNVTTGELTVDRGIYTFDGIDSIKTVGTTSTNAQYISSQTRSCVNNDLTLKSNQYSTVVTSAPDANEVPSIRATVSTLYVFDNRFTDLETAASLVTANPIQIEYALPSPITYQLNPTEITTLLGRNNIWADTGDIEIVYRADTKKYIENLTTPDNDMIADANIPSGKYFMINNTLYLSTVAITSGEAIVPGTNCTLTNLAEALNTLNA